MLRELQITYFKGKGLVNVRYTLELHSYEIQRKIQVCMINLETLK